MREGPVILRLVDVAKINVSLNDRALDLANQNAKMLSMSRSAALVAAIINLNASLKRGEKVSLTLPTDPETAPPRSA